MKLAGCHVPNTLRARDENGRMICARCGQPYDAAPQSARTVTPEPDSEAQHFDGTGGAQ